MSEHYDPETYSEEWNYLQTGTIIDQYMIERELAHGGFSSVYLARQLKDQVQVAIKEYLPRKLAHRTWNNVVTPHNEENRKLFMHGRALFFEEAKVLADLKHPNIVDVINFFQANDTVYMVMTYDYGLTLDKILKKKQVKIDEQFMRTVFIHLLAGVAIIHQKNLLHLDIKPANILIRTGFDPLLLDFGAIEQYPIPKKFKRTKVLTKGFSPIEQYSNTIQLGPWSDIYAIGATMRACVEAKQPIPAPERNQQDKLTPAVKALKNKLPRYLLEAMDWAMAVHPAERPHSVQQLMEVLNPPSH